MRKALPLVALVALVTGCGGRMYSSADVHRAFRDFPLRSIDLASHGVTPGSSENFATLAAVTELRLDPGNAIPADAYTDRGIDVLRFRSVHDAWIAIQSFRLLVSTALSEVPNRTIGGVPHFTGRRGNVILFVLRSGPAESRARADLARLH